MRIALLWLFWISMATAAGALAFRGITKSTQLQLTGEIVARVDTTQPVIALTFDDGPTARHTPALLAALETAGAKATFFLIGSAIEAHPSAAALIVAGGHEIGNHSWAHDRLIFMGRKAVRADLARTDAAIRATGYAGPIPMRPPFGSKLLSLPQVLAEQGRPAIMWSLAPEGQPGDLAQRAIERAEAGDILILHGMYEANAVTREALPRLLAGLAARGFTFVTVSELLALRTE